jgi:hypothetical protein
VDATAFAAYLKTIYDHAMFQSFANVDTQKIYEGSHEKNNERNSAIG